MSLQATFWRDITIDVSDNPADGHSASYNLGQHLAGMVPISIRIPTNLQGSVRLAIFSADVDATDGTGFNVLAGFDGVLDHMTLVADTVSSVPNTVRLGCIGQSFIRLVTMDGASAAREPDDDMTFRVYFAEEIA